MSFKKTVFKTIFIFSIIGITLLNSGCSQTIDELPTSTIELINVTQKSYQSNPDEGYVEFSFNLPKDWCTDSSSYTNCYAYSDNVQTENPFFKWDSRLHIERYLEPNTTNNDLELEEQEFLNDLFSGNLDGLEEYIEQSILNSEETAKSLYQYLYPDNSLSQNTSMETKLNWIQCKVYQRQYGKLVTLEYDYLLLGQKCHALYCYREDIPYVIMAGYNDQLEVSTGDFATQTADSLSVKEDFS